MPAVQTSKRGQCRIIAGKWRGRMIKFDDAAGLRPTTDRIRETVFNWLQPYISQSRCLDCFAGSGVLGFEALSRGAKEVVFFDSNKKTVVNLKENSRQLKAENAVIYHRDVVHWLQSLIQTNTVSKHYDLVFLDPPFHSDLLAKCCTLLDASGCLAADAIIYVEHGVAADVSFPPGWDCIKEKNTGQVSYKLFVQQTLENEMS